jgi:lipopolysaccharide export system permease protein
MLLIYRSILKEMLLAFFISIVFLNATLVMEKMLRLSKVFASVGATVVDIVKMMLYVQPQILILTLPMALLLSTLLVYGRMNADNELTILKGSGISFFKISRPVAYVGLVCLCVSLIMGFYLGPQGAVALREEVTEILSTRAPMTIEEGVFNTAFKDVVILVREKPDSRTMRGIFIVDDRKIGEQKVLVAREGKIIPKDDGLGFSLSKGKIYLLKGETTTEISFDAYLFRLTPHIDSPRRTINEMTPKELLIEAEKGSDKGLMYILEYHRRLSMPAMVVIIIILGPSLALLAGKSGRLGGLTIGLAVFGVYYTLLIYGENLALTKKIPPFVGAWGAFALMVLLSIVVLLKVNRR